MTPEFHSGRWRTWLAAACLLAFVLSGAAQSAHLHRGLDHGGLADTHCVLCAALHFAPLPAVANLAAPVFACQGTLQRHAERSPLALSIFLLNIRPPPSA